MNPGRIARRFLVPPPLVTLVCLLKYRSKVSPRAEVELSPLLRMGRGSVIGSFTKVKASDGTLEIGRDVHVGTGCFISSGSGGVVIGDDCLISPNVVIVGNNYRYDRLDVPVRLQEKTSRGIRIGRNVWLGAGVTVLDGASIGDNVIVAPNSVVSGRVAANEILQGNPAKVVFTRR